jgi:hypothetical protein
LVRVNYYDCKYCGTSVSEYATQCPYCGAIDWYGGPSRVNTSGDSSGNNISKGLEKVVDGIGKGFSLICLIGCLIGICLLILIIL